MNDIVVKLKNCWNKYWLMLLSGIVSAVICFTCMSAFFCRSYAIGMLKNQFEDLEKVLNSMGYDYAYDDLRFYSFSPWQIMRAKNLRIYALDENDFLQWNVEEFNVDVGLWNYEKIDIFLGSKQAFQYNQKVWNISVDDSEIMVELNNGGFENLTLKAHGIFIKNLMKIENLDFNLKHQKSPYLTADVDVKGVVIDDMTGWPLNKLVDHIYVNAVLNGDWDAGIDVSDALYEWIAMGGSIGVNKLILNWKPLIVVANGDIIFNEKLEPTISLNTASLALSETLDRLNEQGFISNKGTFVAKILLNNKAVQQKDSDKYKMVVSPLKITNDKIWLENIRIR